MSSYILRAVYEYESTDTKVLNFKVDEKFVVIKEMKPNDWVYCVNSLGQLGYVPRDYVLEEQVCLAIRSNSVELWSFAANARKRLLGFDRLNRSALGLQT